MIDTSLPRRRLLLIASISVVATLAGWTVWRAVRGGMGSPAEAVPDTEQALPAVDVLGADLARRIAERLGRGRPEDLYPALRKRVHRFHPNLGYVQAPNRDDYRPFPEHPDGGFAKRTNEYGWCEDESPKGHPDVRLLLVGDSHMAGVCATDESAANQLETLLAARRPRESVEVWNVAQGGFNLTNYVGVLDAYGDLDPHLLVLVLYGGNDFFEGFSVVRALYGLERMNAADYRRRAFEETHENGVGLLAQELRQAITFLHNPGLRDLAVQLTVGVAVELQRQCRERGGELLFAYLPPPSRAQPLHFGELVGSAARELDLPESALEVSDELADRALALLADRDIATVDLRGRLRASSDTLYWFTGLHLNVLGQRIVAEELEHFVQRLLDD